MPNASFKGKQDSEMTKSPKTVVFDVGNVLLRWKPEEFYMSILGEESKVRWYMEHVHTPEWNLALDAGLEWDKAFDERVAQFPEWEEPLRAYQSRWFDSLKEPVESNVALLKHLRSVGIPTYVITNFNDYTFRLLQKRLNFLNLFDGEIVSGEEHLVKPDPAIYRLLTSRYGLDLETCIFIDDNADNIAAARDLGMVGIHFTEPMDVRASLKKIGLSGI